MGRRGSNAGHLIYQGEPSPAPRCLRPAHRVGPQPMNPSSREPQLHRSRLLWVPGSPVACPGGQGGVIYREDENLSRKFVPINIAVPGSSSPRGAGGRAGQTLQLLLYSFWAEARGGGKL